MKLHEAVIVNKELKDDTVIVKGAGEADGVYTRVTTSLDEYNKPNNLQPMTVVYRYAR